MIRIRLRIGNGGVCDSFDEWGLLYIDADKRTAPPIKDYDTTNYLSENGVNIDSRTTYAPFDYKVSFVVQGKNHDLQSANELIQKFNKTLFTEDSNGVLTANPVTICNDHDRVKIVGIPQPIAEPKEFYRLQSGRMLDCVEVEFVVKATAPSLCDFNMPVPVEEFIQSDLENKWFGYYYNEEYKKNYVYTAIDGNGKRTRGLQVRVFKGDKFHLISSWGPTEASNAIPWLIIDEERELLAKCTDVKPSVFEGDYVAEYDGILCVNCNIQMMAPAKQQFHMKLVRGNNYLNSL